MNSNILEVNVDNLYSGGVFSLVWNVICHKSNNAHIDIAALEYIEGKDVIEELRNNGVTVHYFGYRGPKIVKQLMIYKKLKNILENNEYDYVHIHSDTAVRLFIMGLAAQRVRMKNIILHSHAADIEGKNRILKKILHYMLRRQLKQIGTMFVACSQKAKDWMFPNISNDKVRIIYNGIDVDKFKFNSFKREIMRNQLKVGNSFLIGHIGRFDYSKNHHFMLNLVKKLDQKHFDFKMLFVGDGPFYNSLKDYATELGIINKCIFYGTTTSVEDLYQAMDVFILPSLNEGFGMCAIEAEAAGLPVIISDHVPRDVMAGDMVERLSIQEKDLSIWCDKIISISKSPCRVYTNVEKLREAKMSIIDTTKGFMSLYGIQDDIVGVCNND